MVKREEFTFDSRDGKSKIHAVRWVPEGKVICILQIVHGMAEHILRYEEVAQYFASKGILVTGEDHLGHGKSVAKDGIYGYFCEQDPATVAVRDVHRLKKMTQEDYPGIPYVILGHSMGSFMLRSYLCRYGTGIQGAMIFGTGYMPMISNYGAKLLAKSLKLLVGDENVSDFLDKAAFGSYNKRIAHPKTKFDWLTSDEAAVEKYISDPLCGFKFTVNGFSTLFELMGRSHKMEALEKMPRELPVCFAAGKDDPVGCYGNGVEDVASIFKDRIGMKHVTVKIYPGCRHEVLNEKNRQQVYEDIYAWIVERVKEYQI